MRGIGLLGVMLGCSDGKDTVTSPPPPPEDLDEDGFGTDVDCDDHDDAVFPGAPDVPYDGVDADCAGNDDDDGDGDGHVSDEHGGDDCVDSNPDISPGLPEVPYDLLDNDCDPATPDDDVDQDGFVLRDDCDDDDAATFPGGLEVLGDAADGDCDGEDDGAAFGHGDLTWISPSRPRILSTAEGFVVAVSAEAVGGGPFYPDDNAWVAIALTFDPLAVGGAAPLTDPLVWRGERDDDVLTDVDVAATATGFVGATSYYSEVNRYGYLFLQPARWQPAVGWILEAPSYLDEVLVDFGWVDVALDAGGTPWICSSDDDSIGYARLGAGLVADGGVAAVDGARGCFLEPGAGDPMPFTTCGGGGPCTTWRTDPDGADPAPLLAPGQPWAAEEWTSVRERDGALTAVAATGGLVLVDDGERLVLLDALSVTDGEAVREADGTVWVAAVADRGNGAEIVLAWGDPLTGALSETWLALEDAGRAFAPTGATVEVTADRVAVAVTGDDVGGGADTVAWAFFGR